ncbi:unnamed protein product [Fraxinus pennsylvanica]|uniref:Malectin domain-containing protein n=1 Tax=Fraxinus pennsylvanica TaxID=56036 RepID=A0AAD2DIM5_9LAMI|nr:unnamed protein product [Fraxinus pennsylvanica]
MYLHPVSIVNLFFFILHLLFTFTEHSAGYYLNGDVAINCGSTGISTAFNGREWVGDISNSPPQIKGSSTSSSTIHNLASVDPVPYKTARISQSQFSYTFRVRPGLKLIRLHFSLALYWQFKKSRDFFTVEVGPFTLLRNFSASITADALSVKSFIKEYSINIEENQLLTITFSPEHSQSHKTYAFINGIEVISLPTDLYYTHEHSAGYYLNGDVAINCGSTGISTAFNGREWVGDISNSPPQIKGSSTSSSTIHNLASVDPVPYKTARISQSQFSYTFRVRPGLKLIRLHFSLALYWQFKKSRDFFTVEVGPFTLLRNFSASITADALSVKSFIKEYSINIEENQLLTITFSPEHSQSHKTYAFINGIEVISLPTDLYYTHGGGLGAQVVGQKSRIYIDKSTALEIVERFNIIWDPTSVANAGKFRMWETVSYKKKNKINTFTWKISVDVGFEYLIRLHFYEKGLRMAETGNMVYSVLINDMIAETNVDIVKERGDNDILWYRDYIVKVKGHKEEARHDLTISLQLKGELIDGPLRRLELCKLSNLYNSLASRYPSSPTQASSSGTLRILLSISGRRNAVVTGAVIITTLVNIIAFRLRQIWEANAIEDRNKPSISTGGLCRHYSLAEIQSATDNFSDTLESSKSSVPKMTTSDGVQPCSRETIKLTSTGVQEISSVDGQNISPLSEERTESEVVQNVLPSGRSTPVDGRKTNIYKLSWLRPWDAIWNRAKPSKRRESVHCSISGIESDFNRLFSNQGQPQ